MYFVTVERSPLGVYSNQEIVSLWSFSHIDNIVELILRSLYYLRLKRFDGNSSTSLLIRMYPNKIIEG